MSGSVGDDEYSDTVSIRTTSTSEGSDLLDKFLENYTVDPLPAAGCLKLRKCVGASSIGMNYHVWGAPETGALMLNVKPLEKGSHPWLHKLELAPQSKVVRVSTAKRSLLGFVVARAWAEYNFETRRFGANWKVTTKWNLGVGRAGRKECYQWREAMEFRPTWKVKAYLPEVEGRLGAARRDEEAVHVEHGYCHVTVPRVELLLWTDRAVQAVRRVRPFGQPRLQDSAQETTCCGTGSNTKGAPQPAADLSGAERSWQRPCKWVKEQVARILPPKGTRPATEAMLSATFLNCSRHAH